MFQMSSNRWLLPALLTALILILAVVNFRQAQAQSDAQILSLNQPVERALKVGETHFFQFALKKGEYARVEVEQKNIDVLVSLFDMDGKLLVEMDGNNIDLWRETVSVIAERSGTYRLQIRANGTGVIAGSYAIKIVEARESTGSDRKRIEAEHILIEAIKLDHQNNLKEAAKAYETALNLWREIGDQYWAAVAMIDLAWVYFSDQNNNKALELHNQALKFFQEAKDRMGESYALAGIGSVYRISKKYEEARNYLEQALAVRRELKRIRGEYNTLNGLILVYTNLKQFDKAVESLDRMLAISKEWKDRSLEAGALKSYGDYYTSIDRYAKTADYYEQALPIYRDELKDKKNQALILQTLGLIAGRSAEFEKARDYLEQVVALKRESGEKPDDWEAFRNLGLVYQALDQYEKALAYYEQALEIAKTLKDGRRAEGSILGQIGSLYSGNWRQFEKAKGYFEQVLTIAIETKDQINEASALRSLASAYIGLGELEKAEDYSQQYLAISRKINRSSESSALSGLGLMYLISGKYEKARDPFEQALAINRELGDRHGESATLSNLALLNSFLSQYEKSRDYSEQALIIAREQKSLRHELNALNGLGVANTWLSQFEKAKGYYEEVLVITRTLKDRRSESSTLNSLGNVCISLSQYEKARVYQEQALAIAREVKSRLNEGISLTNLGKVHANLNQNKKARDYYEQGLAIAREEKNRFGEYDALLHLGYAYLGLSQYDQARDYLEKAKTVAKEIRTRINEIDLLFGFGAISSDLSKQGEAANYYQQSLTILKYLKNRRGEGILLNALGETHLNLKDYAKAKEYFEQALAAAVDVKDRASESAATINLGEVYLNSNQYEKAQDFYKQGLALAKEVKRRGGEGYALNGLGELFFKRNRYEKAQDFYQQALMVAKEVKSKKLEGRVLWNLMELLNKQKNPRLAGFYGKQAINAFQEIRGNIKSFDKETQQTYLKDKEKAYRVLADILIAQGRFAQAQQVLRMLKEEEYSDFVRRDSDEIKSLNQRLDFEGDDKEIIERYNLLATRVSEIGQQYAELDEKQLQLKQARAHLSAEEQNRYEELKTQLGTANAAFKLFLDKVLVAELGEKAGHIEVDRSLLQGHLQQWGNGTVLLYTVVGEDRYRVFLTTSNVQVDGKHEIKAAELNKKVFAFRTALQNPQIDPRPLGKELYDILIKPIEKDLEAVGAKTLVWSLDGTLRYIPFAALSPDGKQYLVEKYQNVIITPKTLTDISTSNAGWCALGLGISQKESVANPDNPQEKLDFNELPGTKTELMSIVRDEQSQDEKGVLTGRRFLDEGFTIQNFIDALRDRTEEGKRKYTVIHIASHFRLGSNWSNSFLLLGNGKILTLKEINNSPDIRFGDVELITLSACNTAFANKSNGKEVDSLAEAIQTRSGKAILATLWSVADESTSLLMSEFYRLHKENPKLTKAEALQLAQRAMIQGRYKTSAIPHEQRAVVVAGAADSQSPSFKRDDNAPYAHPYFWSPFVLIGNWK